LDIVNEIMSIREQRRGNDYVQDEAQDELTKVLLCACDTVMIAKGRYLLISMIASFLALAA